MPALPPHLLLCLAVLCLWPAASGWAEETAPAAAEAPATGGMAEVEAAYLAQDFGTARRLLETMVTPDAGADAGPGPVVRYRLAHMLLEGKGGPADLPRAVALLTGAAEAGHAEAQMLLGQLHLAGQGVPRDPAQAASLLSAAARQGNATAQLWLARLYAAGLGVAQDDASAVQLLLRASGALTLSGEPAPDDSAGLPAAQYLLSRHLARGQGIAADLQAARGWLHRAAEGGDGAAQLALSVELREGPAELRNPADSALWLRRAAESGLPLAQRMLGMALLQGEEAIAQDAAQGLDWLTRASGAGEAGAQANLGYLYASGTGGVAQDFAAAALWYAKAADQGLLRAQTALARLYETGRGRRQSLLRAVDLYQQAAGAGEPGAQRRLAELIVAGQAQVPPDRRRAMGWIAAQAQRGNAAARDWIVAQAATGETFAQAALGALYLRGADPAGPEQAGPEQAVALLQSAAGKGEEAAMLLLAQAYAEGLGVAQDYVLAHQWANLSAARGNAAAAALRQTLAQVMTPDQIATAQDGARAYVAD